MCGIAGIISMRDRVSHARLKVMTDSLGHRGPDGEGWWSSDDGAVGLGSRRLAILDLSREGSQPMLSADGRYCIVYNGEIYNYKEIRATHAQKGILYHGNSDTEVALNHFSLLGEKALHDFDGMFAFAIWDAAQRELFCARDRFGEKPFYYFHKPGVEFLFASEIKALLAAGVQRSINHSKLCGYFRNPANPLVPGGGDETFFEGVLKLGSATSMFVSRRGSVRSTKRYWHVSHEIRTELSFDEAKEEFLGVFSESVARRLRSDVPVGSSLSGGIDSSAIVCLVRELQPAATYNTFSARFNDFEADEGEYIALVNEWAQTVPHLVFPTEADLAHEIGEFCYFQDEPVESSSAFAQWSVMQRAAQDGVVVLLDGHGGDESAAGYPEYIPTYLAELARTDRAAAEVEAAAFEEHYRLDSRPKPNSTEPNFAALGRAIVTVKQLARRRFSNTPIGRSLPTHTFLSRAYMWEHGVDSRAADVQAPFDLNSELARDLVDGKLENYLRYADRSSMAHSREVRLPFLAHQLVEFMFSLPATYKIQSGWTKYVVRKALEGRVPPRVLWRKEKVGFATPSARWLNSPAMQMRAREAHSYLVQEGIVNKSWVSGGERDWAMIMAHFLLTGAERASPAARGDAA
jgi:asparagine synthase (glutamine-hydrolysing)